MTNLYKRLVARCSVPEGQCETGCWTYSGKHGGRTGNYPRLNIRARGKHKTIAAHRAMLVILECAEEPDLFFDLYEFYQVAGFEADHLCERNPSCINPDHLQWLDKLQHQAKTIETWANRRATT